MKLLNYLSILFLIVGVVIFVTGLGFVGYKFATPYPKPTVEKVPEIGKGWSPDVTNFYTGTPTQPELDLKKVCLEGGNSYKDGVCTINHKAKVCLNFNGGSTTCQ